MHHELFFKSSPNYILIDHSSLTAKSNKLKSVYRFDNVWGNWIVVVNFTQSCHVIPQGKKQLSLREQLLILMHFICNEYRCRCSYSG